MTQSGLQRSQNRLSLSKEEVNCIVGVDCLCLWSDWLLDHGQNHYLVLSINRGDWPRDGSVYPKPYNMVSLSSFFLSMTLHLINSILSQFRNISLALAVACVIVACDASKWRVYQLLLMN